MEAIDEKVIEAVARAICAAEPGNDPDETGGDIQGEQRAAWRMWEGEARAAIRAHLQHLADNGYVAVPREPTAEMNGAALEVLEKGPLRTDFTPQFQRVWIVMIEAAHAKP